MSLFPKYRVTTCSPFPHGRGKPFCTNEPIVLSATGVRFFLVPFCAPPRSSLNLVPFQSSSMGLQNMRKLMVAQECTSTSRPQRDRPCSALCPHYVRTTPVVFPHRFRSISAIFPHCSRGISALLLLRSLSAPFPQHIRSLSALFPRHLRTVAAVLPHCSRGISALLPQSFRTVPAVLPLSFF